MTAFHGVDPKSVGIRFTLLETGILINGGRSVGLYIWLADIIKISAPRSGNFRSATMGNPGAGSKREIPADFSRVGRPLAIARETCGVESVGGTSDSGGGR